MLLWRARENRPQRIDVIAQRLTRLRRVVTLWSSRQIKVIEHERLEVELRSRSSCSVSIQNHAWFCARGTVDERLAVREATLRLHRQKQFLVPVSRAQGVSWRHTRHSSGRCAELSRGKVSIWHQPSPTNTFLRRPEVSFCSETRSINCTSEIAHETGWTHCIGYRQRPGH